MVTIIYTIYKIFDKLNIELYTSINFIYLKVYIYVNLSTKKMLILLIIHQSSRENLE